MKNIGRETPEREREKRISVYSIDYKRMRI
jgi:hypothetical protein